MYLYRSINLLYAFRAPGVCTEDAMFILVRTERSYFQSSVTCATGTIDDQTRSKDYKRLREGGEASKSLYRGGSGA
jgi:hypothetical protein